MRLTDFLQLTNDLNNQTNLYLTIDQKAIPLAKVKITSTACLFIPGKKPLTKDKFIKLVQNIHGRSITIYISQNDQKISVYGIQIMTSQNAIRLT
ncbi:MULTISPECIES: hypothetical protein [Lactobacillus]|uniref:hypothetical protein n=1 Tax=Lactobacillus TaxID=1578 RepID=UPI000D6F986D|nr:MULTISPECIES: hypothetical protein [Lactobacillus]AWN33161.1 hypothetical protein DLD54_02920 [Lactobacillus helsingborgensis]RMC53625.1 hypothetical protein F5ESL0262_02880 [Lactobacillus sp. ESL0262]